MRAIPLTAAALPPETTRLVPELRRTYLQSDLKLLFSRAGDRCAFPGCQQALTEEATSADPAIVLGRIAHIVGDSDTGPRADPFMPRDERRRYPNLILLCPTHHDLVDGQDSTYTADDLRRWKQEHESWVQTRLTEEAAEITFEELAAVTGALETSPVRPEGDLVLLDPTEKMQRNDLTFATREWLQIGQLRFQDVQAFVSDTAKIDPTFPDRLKVGFVDEYNRRVAEGEHGDGLFSDMWDFASARSLDFKRRASALAVLTYLFHICDIFET
jgi:hypothetical protein